MAERHEEELRGTKAFFPTAVAGLTDVASPSKPCVVTVISFSSKAIDFLPRTPMTAAVSPCCCGCFCCAGTPGAEPWLWVAAAAGVQICDVSFISLFLFPFLSFPAEHKCPVDQREQLEETLPLILGLILGLVIVITLCVYHIHHKLTANQVQIPRDRSQYKHMG